MDDASELINNKLYKRGEEQYLAVHFSQGCLAHLLLSVALARGRIEHSALLELFTRILHAIASNDLER